MGDAPDRHHGEMQRTRLDPALESYLDQLRVASRDLPTASQRDLSARAWRELAEELSPDPDEQEVRAVLARLESPTELAAAERERLGLTVGRDYGVRERSSMLLLLGSPVLPVLGLIAGMALLWSSPGWARRTRTVTTALVAIGTVTGLLLLVVGLGPVLALLIGLLALGPVAGGVYLLAVSAPARRDMARARRRASSSRRARPKSTSAPRGRAGLGPG